MELFFRKYGEGKPIIILHGLFGMSDNWVSIAKKLGENYEVFVPDMRNHGQSPHSEVFNYESMVKDVLEFIEFHKIHNPFLIGHSMGGKVTMKLAIENNNLPSGIIVVDISPKPYKEHYEHLDVINAMESLDLTIVKSFSDIDKQLSAYPIPLRLRQFLLKNVTKKENNQYGWKFNLEAIKLNLNKMIEGINQSTVNSPQTTYSGPTLFIKGGHSDYMKPEDFGIIKNMFLASEIFTIPNATHWVHADAPEAFLQIVKEFLIRC